jgi:hypothetical protein
MKRVTIGITMDNEFIRLLRASVTLNRLRDKDELTPIDQLALLALGEAMGGLEEQVHAAILHVWRPHIQAASEVRRVQESD